jgi:integrase/recombinase XerC
MKFNQAIEKFSDWRRFKVKNQTVRGYDKELRSFCLFLRNPDIEGISLGHVMEYLNGMQELGWSRNSFIPKCMALRKFFEFFKMQGYAVLDQSLIPIPRKEYAVPRVATEEDYRKLLSVIPSNNDPRHIRNRAIIKLLWDSGARNGEVVSLDLGDIDFDRKRAIIKTEKSRGRRPLREIFWTHETNESLGAWVTKRAILQKRDPNALFLAINAVNVGERFTIKGVGEMLRRYSNRAKMPHVNPHSFRHHMGHEIVKRGGSAADVMNILGHATLASSSIYTMMADKELEQRYRMFHGN